MLYNIIGDIHSRECWRDVVVTDAINVFVGDYFAPYEQVPFEKQRDIFLDIIKYKEEHPETILLIGNHDAEHWHIEEHSRGFDIEHLSDIRQLFEDHAEYFSVAYSIENKALVSHAGVSVCWYVCQKYNMSPKRVFVVDLDGSHINNTRDGKILPVSDVVDTYWKLFGEQDDMYDYEGDIYVYGRDYYVRLGNVYEKLDVTPDNIAEFVNNAWNDGLYDMFSFRHNTKSYYDYYGTGITHGPMWIRAGSITQVDIFDKKYKQFVGHTQFGAPTESDGIIFVDCLGYSTASVLYNPETNEYTVNTQTNKE